MNFLKSIVGLSLLVILIAIAVVVPASHSDSVMAAQPTLQSQQYPGSGQAYIVDGMTGSTLRGIQAQPTVVLDADGTGAWINTLGVRTIQPHVQFSQATTDTIVVSLEHTNSRSALATPTTGNTILSSSTAGSSNSLTEQVVNGAWTRLKFTVPTTLGITVTNASVVVNQ